MPAFERALLKIELVVKARLTSEAEIELQEASIWHDRKRVGLGDELRIEVRDLIARIERNPEQFGFYEGSVTKRTFRRALTGRFSYAVIFRLEENEIVVYAIKHTSREPGYWERR